MQTCVQTENGGASAKALDYTLKSWPNLIRYAHTSHLPIDNNPVENAIRPIAIGRKNWLFTGSERAEKRAAAIQTLFGRRAGACRQRGQRFFKVSTRRDSGVRVNSTDDDSSCSARIRNC
jgi:transposase IS66 family protein